MFTSSHIMTQQAKRRQENLEWEGVIGSLTSATIATNFEPETDETVLRGVQSVSSFGRHTRCIVGKTFLGLSRSKINTSQ